MDYEAICAGVRAQRKKYLTQQEVAALCHLSKKTIYKLERSGVLPYEEQGDRLIHTHRIKTADVLAMLKERHCRQGKMDLYLRTMTRYYTKLLRKEADVLELVDVIRLTGFSKSGVLNWLLRGTLPSIRKGRSYLIPKSYLRAFLLSPVYRRIKNKSEKQKADTAAIEALYQAALRGGDGNG